MVATAFDEITDARIDRMLPVHDLLAQLIAVAPTESGRSGEVLFLHHRREFDRGYTAAVMHILERLSTVVADRELLTATVISPDGRYCLELLQDLLGGPSQRSATSTYLASEDSPVPPLRLADTLVALEQLRLRRNPAARPIRNQRAVLGLILRVDTRGCRQLLLLRDPDSGELHLPGGRVEVSDASLEMALRRELTEELGCGQLLTPELVQLERVAPPFALERLSPTKGLLTRTTFDVFAVRLTRGLPDLREDMHWLDTSELADDCAVDQLTLPSPLLAAVKDHGVELAMLPLSTAR